MSVISNNICEIISKPAGINISQAANPRLFQKVLIRDSILGFFPYGEIHLLDKQGIINSMYGLLEGMRLSVKLGFPETTDDNDKTIGGYIQQDFGWSEDQINSTVKDTEYVSGINSLIIISNAYFNDFENPSAFKQQPSDIAHTIATEVFKITDETKIHIDPTSNDLEHIWYQGNRTSRRFLEQTLTQRAYGTSVVDYEKTPYVSFINCNGEFYFCSYATLFKQSPIATYEQKLDTHKLLNYYLIQDITFAAGGAPLNKIVYNQNIHTLNDDGTFNEEQVLLQDKVVKLNTNLDRYPVYKENAKNTTRILNFGLYEEKDLDIFEAQKTFLFQNSCLAFRIDIVILFNPKAVAGKVIELKIKDFLNNDQYSTLLSGNWLIISSEHYMDQDAAIYSHLTVARPSLTFKSDWPYIANIIA